MTHGFCFQISHCLCGGNDGYITDCLEGLINHTLPPFQTQRSGKSIRIVSAPAAVRPDQRMGQGFCLAPLNPRAVGLQVCPAAGEEK